MAGEGRRGFIRGLLRAGGPISLPSKARAGARRPGRDLVSGGGSSRNRLHLLRLRRVGAQVARALPGLRGVEHARRGARAGGRAPRAAGRRRAARRRPVRWRCATSAPQHAPRLSTGIGELDRVLGGGLVPGSLVLLGGSPGIGKSTLTNMALGHLAAAGRGTLYVSGEESAAQIRLRAERLGRVGARRPRARRDRPRHRARRRSSPSGPTSCVIDSVQTLHSAALESAPGLRRPGPRGRRADHRGRQAPGHRRHPRRPRDQGGRARRPARARAPRRLRAAVRGRARAHLPHAARAEEPLRLDERGRRLRDARGRPRRGARRERALRRRGDEGAGLGRARRDGGLAAAARRGPGARLASPSSCRRGASATASTATASRSCSPCSPATRASAWAPATSSSTSSAACAIDEPGADLAVALAVASAARGVAA